MNQEMINYLIPAAIILYFVFKFFKFKKVKSILPEILKQGATIVDVRSPGEFNMARNELSINIPLDNLANQLKKIDPTKPVILCCASGTRSGIAVGILKANGYTQVYNAGSWSNTII